MQGCCFTDVGPCPPVGFPSVGKTQIIKMDVDDLTRRVKNIRTRSGAVETTKSLVSDDMNWESNRDSWIKHREEVVSNSSRSVVSISVSNGDAVLFACSGIAIEREGIVTRFLTSAGVVRAFDSKSLKIEIHHDGNTAYGNLGEYDLDVGYAFVDTIKSLDVQVLHLKPAVEMAAYTKVVAVGRCIYGNLLATNGILTYDSNGSEYNEGCMLSTCRISEAWEGGPLLDIKGNFVGMNLLSVNKRRTVFLPARRIFELSLHVLLTLRRIENLKLFRSLVKDKKSDGISRSSKKNKRSDDVTRSSKKHKRTDELTRISKKHKRTDDLTITSKKQKGTDDDISKSSKKSKINRNGGGKTTGSLNSVKRNVLTEKQVGALDSLGYPKPLTDISKDRQVLVHSFEETFGDTYDGGVWSGMSKTVSSNISRNVVALASFYGETRIFACTGFLIEWNGCTTILTSASLISKFVDARSFEKLRIEVLLPNNECTKGILLHCNLCYNVALVSVKDFHAPHPANIRPMGHYRSCELLAVGRCFKSGILMAASGHFINMIKYKLDCKLLQYSACKITKAGIGGPLVDFDGNFIGMNFFARKGSGTPFLPSDVILDVLAYFEEKGATVADVGLDYHRGVLDWSISGDRSVGPNRWPVPKPYWCQSELANRPSHILPRYPRPRFHRGRVPHVFHVNGQRVAYM